VRQTLHLWPELLRWLKELQDTRFLPYIEYEKEFLVWSALMVFLCELRSRRMIDYDLRELEGWMLANLNELAGTKQTSLPVNKTVSHALGHIGPEQIVELQNKMVGKLLRNKVMESCRLYNGMMRVAVDATGMVSFRQRHCPRCLERKTSAGSIFQHHVLEAKLVSPSGLAISLCHEFIENPDGITEQDYGKIKQDCELKAFARLAAKLKATYPRLPICLLGDALYCCGTVIDTCQRNGWGLICTFKEGRTPSLWREFNALLDVCPENTLTVQQPDGTGQRYRWINSLPHFDRDQHEHNVNAVLLEETRDGTPHTFAYLTNIQVKETTASALAHTGGRSRWKIENQGFNYQKNSGLNLKHPYSHDERILKCFYTLLQIAHMMLQLFFAGSPLMHLAARYGKTPLQLFGSLAKICQRLLECLRYYRIPRDAFDQHAARSIQLRLNTS